MKIWEDIVNNAMLGTEKAIPGKSELPEQLNQIFNQINEREDLDRESKFLQQAAIVYNYRKSGFKPLKKADIQVLVAEEETLPYANANATLALNKVLNEGSSALLLLWMQQCATKNQLIPADFLPEILEQAIAQVTIRKLLVHCAGNRGKWLSQLNPEWDYLGPDLSEDEIWLTGKPDERQKLLQSISEKDPDRARAMLMQTWSLENSAQKLEFLKVLKQNRQVADLPWLESLSAEKGQKIKDAIQNLLRQIPGSSSIEAYEVFLTAAFSLKKEKALLGMLSKTVLQFKFPDSVDERIYKSGIEKLRGTNSQFSDEEHITAQIIQHVPPVFWEKYFEASPDQIIAYFEKYADKFINSLAIAVSTFECKPWVQYLVGQPVFYPDFLAMMTPVEQEKYLLRFKAQLADEVIYHALNMEVEWSLPFATKMLQLMFANTYRFSLPSYRKHIMLIPVALLAHLDNIIPEKVSPNTTLDNLKQELHNLLALKQQIQQAF